jgi:hypothetical protein
MKYAIRLLEQELIDLILIEKNYIKNTFLIPKGLISDISELKEAIKILQVER